MAPSYNPKLKIEVHIPFPPSELSNITFLSSISSNNLSLPSYLQGIPSPKWRFGPDKYVTGALSGSF